MGLRYCGIRVRDLDRSTAFYVGLLGLKEVGRRSTRRAGTWVLLEDPRTHQRLELNWYPPGSRFAIPYVPGDGLDHLGFHVARPAETVRRLRRAGVEMALDPSAAGGIPGVYYLKDPDGNWVEIF